MGEQVADLMSVSLLRQQAKWKDKVEALRQQVDALQPLYPGMKGWRMHWDMQLFKALEHQYQTGLEGLHKDLPQLRCDLEFKGRRMQLRPPLEELRTDFYREIKKFISIPTGFKGLGYFDEAKAGSQEAAAGYGQGGGRTKELGKHKVHPLACGRLPLRPIVCHSTPTHDPQLTPPHPPQPLQHPVPSPNPICPVAASSPLAKAGAHSPLTAHRSSLTAHRSPLTTYYLSGQTTCNISWRDALADTGLYKAYRSPPIFSAA